MVLTHTSASIITNLHQRIPPHAQYFHREGCHLRGQTVQ